MFKKNVFDIFSRSIRDKTLLEENFISTITRKQIWSRIIDQKGTLKNNKCYSVKSSWTPDLLVTVMCCLLIDAPLEITNSDKKENRGFDINRLQDNFQSNHNEELLCNNIPNTDTCNSYITIATENRKYHYTDIIRSIKFLSSSPETLATSAGLLSFHNQNNVISELVVLLSCFISKTKKTHHCPTIEPDIITSSTSKQNNNLLHTFITPNSILLFQRSKRCSWKIPSFKCRAILFDGATIIAHGKTCRGRLCIVRAYPPDSIDLSVTHQPRLRIRDAIRYEPLLHHHHLNSQECLQETSVMLPLSSLAVILSSAIIVSKRNPILLHTYRRKNNPVNENWINVVSVNQNSDIIPPRDCLSKITIRVDNRGRTCQIVCCYNVVLGHLFPLLEKIRRQMIDLVIEGVDHVTEETMLPLLKKQSYGINPWVLFRIIVSYCKLSLVGFVQFYCEGYLEEEPLEKVDIYIPSITASEMVPKVVSLCNHHQCSIPVLVWEAKKFPQMYINGSPGGDTVSAFVYVVLSHFIRNKIPKIMIRDLIVHITIVKSDQLSPWLRDTTFHRNNDCSSRQKIVIHQTTRGVFIRGVLLHDTSRRLRELSKDTIGPLE